MRQVTHQTIVEFHEEISVMHKGLNGFYRFNWNEITGQFRKGIGTPALLLESHSAALSANSIKTATFNDRDISFMLLDFTGKADAYDKQDEVLDRLENIAIDIGSYLKKLNNDKTSWLYMKFDPNNYRYEKVGPIFDNMYGWIVLYTLKNHEDLTFEPDKWDLPTP